MVRGAAGGSLRGARVGGEGEQPKITRGVRSGSAQQLQQRETPVAHRQIRHAVAVYVADRRDRAAKLGTLGVLLGGFRDDGSSDEATAGAHGFPVPSVDYLLRLDLQTRTREENEHGAAADAVSARRRFEAPVVVSSHGEINEPVSVQVPQRGDVASSELVPRRETAGGRTVVGGADFGSRRDAPESLSRHSTNTAPELSWAGAPTAMSGTPSSSTSPMPALLCPKTSALPRGL